MKSKLRRSAVAAVAVGLPALWMASASASVTPASNTLTIAAGSSQTETVTIGVPGGAPASADIEIAIDTTGSMASGIAQAQADATALVSAVQASVPSAQFAVVEFKDSTDVVEYRVAQSMTGNAALVQNAVAPLVADGGGDAPEAHNLVFQNAATPAVGGPIGWRTGTRKFVVVLSDAEPHGAGTARVSGCADTSADPHGLSTSAMLSGLTTAQRTLFMILEPGSVSSSLACYQGLAAGAYPGGQGVDGGTNLATQIVSLIGTASATVNQISMAASTTSAPATASWISFTPAKFGPLPAPATVSPTVKVTVPAGTPNGTYLFDLVALADGADVGHQALTVVVTGGGTGGGGGSGPCLATPPAGAIVGTNGPDTIVGTPGDDVIYGLGGNDSISGGGGNDTICGGEGDDRVDGNDGNDQLDGGNGNDEVQGDAGADKLWGGAGRDKLNGSSGNDQLDGGDGTRDVCKGGGGTNTFTACETVK